MITTAISAALVAVWVWAITTTSRKPQPVTVRMTWDQFVRSPLPLTLPEAALRSRMGDDMTCTVYNRAAALGRLRQGRGH